MTSICTVIRHKIPKKSIIDYKKCFLAKKEIFLNESEKAEKNQTLS